MLFRHITVFTLVLTLAACTDQLATNPTTIAPPSPSAVAQATALPTTATTPVPSATVPPTQPPTALATEPATPSAIPAVAATATLTETPAHQAKHVFPIQSKGKISYSRFHHDYPAADIFCPIGSVFVAVTDGVVDYVSSEDVWEPKVNDGATRGGLSVAIIGDDGIRYYGSHLSQIADGIVPGMRVVAGQPLGLTGKSGDARYTEAHLHFGISHPTTPEDWQVRRGEIPPYDYLRTWQRGEDATPDLRR